MNKGWIGVDLDGTLAEYHGWVGDGTGSAQHGSIGKPIPRMVDRVKRWLAEGKEVRIMTARVSPEAAEISGHTIEFIAGYIKKWCKEHIGQELPVTCSKDLHMIVLWDDRAVRVGFNTGLLVDETEGGRLE